MKHAVLSSLLKWIYSEDLRLVVSLDKICAADSYFAIAWLNPMILHTSGCVGSGSIHIGKLDWNRGWNVSHTDMQLMELESNWKEWCVKLLQGMQILKSN